MITRCLSVALAVLTALPGVAEEQRDAALQPQAGQQTASTPQETAPQQIASADKTAGSGPETVSPQSENSSKQSSAVTTAAEETQKDTKTTVAEDKSTVTQDKAAKATLSEAKIPEAKSAKASPDGSKSEPDVSKSEPDVSTSEKAAAATPEKDGVTTSAVTEGAASEAAATGTEPATSEPSVAPLVLLGETVQPGTAAKLSWVAQESFEGISAPTPVLVVHGAKPGPKLCITAGVHGDELNGIEVVRRIIYDLNPTQLTGSVIGVPIVNLQGFRRSSRYLPDRRDLNRYFPGSVRGSSASRIAHAFFQSVVVHCDMVVDLHTGSFHRTNLPQLRADLHNPSVKELAQNMGSIVVLHSRGAGGSLRRAATDRGIPAVTLEAGEPHKVDLDAVDHGVLSVQALLHKRGMYERRSMWTRQIEPMYYKSRWVRSPNGGILASRITLGERVKTGDVLGTVTDPITNYSVEINTPIDGRVIGMALNQVMQPGFAAYHIGFQSTAEEAAKHDAGPDDASGDELEMERPLSQNKAGKRPAAEDAE